MDQRDISPRKITCADDTWNKYENIAQDEKGASNLRSDAQFLDKLINLLGTPVVDIIKN
jgi:hypothetical protein